MHIDQHDLVHEFPEFREKIHALKMNDAHFSRLFEKYHELDHEIVRIEDGVEVSDDDYIEERKKERLALKDELFQMLQRA